MKYRRFWLEQHDIAHVLATRRNDTLVTTGFAQSRADDLVAALPTHAWQRISAGAGAHGPRDYDWARVPIRVLWAPERGHWLLARRSVSDPTEIAYYVCYGPRRSTIADLLAGLVCPHRPDPARHLLRPPGLGCSTICDGHRRETVLRDETAVVSAMRPA